MERISLCIGEYALADGGTLKVIKTHGAGASKLVFMPNGGAQSELSFNENGFMVQPVVQASAAVAPKPSWSPPVAPEPVVEAAVDEAGEDKKPKSKWPNR